MSAYARMVVYIKDVDDWRDVVLVDEFHGRPVYMDVETGEQYCPFDNLIPAPPPIPSAPEYNMWSRIAAYLGVVLKRFG